MTLPAVLDESLGLISRHQILCHRHHKHIRAVHQSLLLNFFPCPTFAFNCLITLASCLLGTCGLLANSSFSSSIVILSPRGGRNAPLARAICSHFISCFVCAFANTI